MRVITTAVGTMSVAPLDAVMSANTGSCDLEEPSDINFIKIEGLV